MNIQPLSPAWEDVYHANLAQALLAPEHELINHTFSLKPFFSVEERAISNPVRGFRLDFSNVMADWILSGEKFVTEDMIIMNPNAAKFATVFDPPHLHESEIVTAYGPRFTEQLGHVMRELTRNPESRRACIMLLSAEDRYVAEALDMKQTKCEYICTYGFNFRLRNGALDMSVSMRSNNYTTTVCQDVFVFARIQQAVAEMLHVGVGRYYHHAVSGHVFKGEEQRAAQILQSYIHTHMAFEYDGALMSEHNGWKPAIRKFMQAGFS